MEGTRFGLLVPILRGSICNTCRRAMRASPRKVGLQNSDRLQLRLQSTSSQSKNTQVNSLEGYYSLLLEQPTSSVSPATITPPSPPPATSLPETDREETLERARIVFGSRLAGPAERRSEIENKSVNVAGVMVPPRPAEPDNCCMSGCVNCVWDQYRDELEEWAARSSEARAKLQAQRENGQGTGLMTAGEGTPTHTVSSMDDDGGGSETNWSTGLAGGFSGGPNDLFADIPVGIREFMKTEKKLKEKHLREGTWSGPS